MQGGAILCRHWPHHPNRNHVGRRLADYARVVRSDPGVECLRHDVGRRVAHRELKVDMKTTALCATLEY
jgi:hypothetical protein